MIKDGIIDNLDLSAAQAQYDAGRYGYYSGDVNLDGFVDNLDVSLIQSFYASGTEGFLPANSELAPFDTCTAIAAVDDTATTSEGESVTILALRNDSGRDAQVTSVQVGTGGTPTLNSDGTVTFEPVAGFTGVAEFTYTITDAYGQTATATVRVTVTPAVSSTPTPTPSSTSSGGGASSAGGPLASTGGELVASQSGLSGFAGVLAIVGGLTALSASLVARRRRARY